MINPSEPCDQCGAPGAVIVVLAVDAGQPDFFVLCQHDANKNADALKTIEARVMPFAALEDLTAETERLEEIRDNSRTSA